MASDFKSFLASLGLQSYFETFYDKGYDDLTFLKTLTAEEKDEMFDQVGLSKKPGHLLKFKKSLKFEDMPNNKTSHLEQDKIQQDAMPSVTTSSSTQSNGGGKTQSQRSKYQMQN